MTRRPQAVAAVLAAAVAFAAPAAALAQNAGDEQYRDPFGKVESKNKGSSGGGQGGTAGQGTSAPAQAAPTAQPTGSQTTASASQTLPRTGLPAWVLAAAGAALLGGGARLRRVTEPR